MTQKPTYANVPEADSGVATKASALAIHTHMDSEQAEAVWDLAEKRASNRQIQRYDALVTLDTWATRDKYEIADSRVLLVGRVSDHSAKAYHCRGAFAIDMDNVADYKYLSNVVSQVDNTDSESIDKYGETYLPKSSVEAIVKLKP